MMRGIASLDIRGTRQRRPADDVPDGVNLLGRGSKVLVDFDLAARVRLNSDRAQIQVFGVARPARRPQQNVSLDLLAGCQMQNDAVVARLDTFARFSIICR